MIKKFKSGDRVRPAGLFADCSGEGTVRTMGEFKARGAGEFADSDLPDDTLVVDWDCYGSYPVKFAGPGSLGPYCFDSILEPVEEDPAAYAYSPGWDDDEDTADLPADNEYLEIGNLVRLRSGGPLMTVQYLTSEKNEAGEKIHSAECAWFPGGLEAATRPATFTFSVDALDVVE